MTRRSSTTYRREAPPLARRLLTMDPPISPHPTTVTSPNIAHSVPLFVLLGAPFGPPAVEPQKEASRPRGRSRLVRVTRRGPSAPPALFLLLGAGLRPRLRCSCYSARAFGPACAVRVTRRGPSAPPALFVLLGAGLRPRLRVGRLELGMPVAAMAARGRFLVLRFLGDEGLGGEHEPRHAGRVLQGRAHDLHRVDDALLEQVAVLAGLRVV